VLSTHFPFSLLLPLRILQASHSSVPLFLLPSLHPFLPLPNRLEVPLSLGGRAAGVLHVAIRIHKRDYRYNMVEPQEGGREGGKEGEGGEGGGKRGSWGTVKAAVGGWWGGGRKGGAEGGKEEEEEEEEEDDEEGLALVSPREGGREGGASTTAEETGSSEGGVSFATAYAKSGMEEEEGKEEGREGVERGGSLKQVGFEGVVRVEV